MNVLLPTADIYTHSLTPSLQPCTSTSQHKRRTPVLTGVHEKGLQASMNLNEQLLYIQWSDRSCRLQTELKSSEYITDSCSFYL